MKEGKALSDPDTTYYDELEDRLELVLTFTEQGAHPLPTRPVFADTPDQMPVNKHFHSLSSRISSKCKLSPLARTSSPGSSRVLPVSQ